MSWWRRRAEVREGGYTETRLIEQFTRAISGNVRHGALGGLQCAASAIARAFAAAEVEGDDGLLDPTTLYSMAFDLVREGQSLWLLDASTGRLRLSRASTGSDVYQGSVKVAAACASRNLSISPSRRAMRSRSVPTGRGRAA